MQCFNSLTEEVTRAKVFKALKYKVLTYQRPSKSPGKGLGYHQGIEMLITVSFS